MSRWTEKYWNGRWWPREEWDAMVEAQRAQRRDGPMVISDTMDATLNHADGRLYDSKRAYERAVRARGFEIVGNDTSMNKPPEYKPVITGWDVKHAIEQLRNRHG
jgi:hypothetical protein